MIETLFQDEINFGKFKAQYMLHFSINRHESFRDIVNRKLLTWYKSIEESKLEQNLVYKMLADCMNSRINEYMPWHYEIDWGDLLLNKVYRQLWDLIWPKVMGEEFGSIY